MELKPRIQHEGEGEVQARKPLGCGRNKSRGWLVAEAGNGKCSSDVKNEKKELARNKDE